MSTWRALPVADGLRREVRRGRRPRHAATPRRRPHLVRGAEVLVERDGVEVGERPRPRDPVDVGGRESRVGDRALRGLGPDLPRGPARRLRVRGLADARDGHLRRGRRRDRSRDPSRRFRARARNVSAAREGRHGVRHEHDPPGVASARRTIARCSATRASSLRTSSSTLRKSISPRRTGASASSSAPPSRTSVRSETPVSRVASSPTSAAYALLTATCRRSRSSTATASATGAPDRRLDRRRGPPLPTANRNVDGELPSVGASNAATIARRISHAAVQKPPVRRRARRAPRSPR